MEELTDDQLIAEAKKMKKGKTTDSFIFGFLVGVAIFATWNKGFGFLTIIPLAWLPIINKNSKKRKELFELLEKRELNIS